MTTGRVLQFDQVKGYGFIAAEDGGEDIFLHTSVFDGEADELVPGARLEFQTMEGDRGRKAFRAHLATEESGRDAQPERVDRPVPCPPAQRVAAPDEEPMCDVLSPNEFGQELTELLLSSMPELTGQQIIDIRRNMLDFAKRHGWSDG